MRTKGQDDPYSAIRIGRAFSRWWSSWREARTGAYPWGAEESRSIVRNVWENMTTGGKGPGDGRENDLHESTGREKAKRVQERPRSWVAASVIVAIWIITALAVAVVVIRMIRR